MTKLHIKPVSPGVSSDRKDTSQEEEESPGDLPLPPHQDPLHKDPLSKNTLLSRFTLPNGLEVYQQGTTQTNIIYSEIFTAEVYLQHGIILPARACVFDVGAHIGLFSLFAHQIQSDIRIFAFEPGSTSYQALCENIKLHNVPIIPFNYGLSSTAGSMPFVFFPFMSGMSGLFADPQKDKEAFKAGIRHWMQENGHEPVLADDMDRLIETFFAQSTSQTCQFKTLSEAMRENDVEHIDLLKIDVEGNEFEVLKGIQEPDWPKIEQVVAEIHNSLLLQQITEHLTKRGYSVTIEVEEGSVLERFEKEGGYRLYMLYASRKKQETSEEITIVNERRHHINPEDLFRLLRANPD